MFWTYLWVQNIWQTWKRLPDKLEFSFEHILFKLQNDIKIDNMDEARFLKEKLCTVLKEFQENKSRSSGVSTVSSAKNDSHLIQSK